MATFNDELTLIKEIEDGRDEYGNPKKTVKKTTILCNKESVYSSEFYSAANVGLKPQMLLTIHVIEYDNEVELIYQDKLYSILRTYRKGELLELVVGDKLGRN